MPVQVIGARVVLDQGPPTICLSLQGDGDTNIRQMRCEASVQIRALPLPSKLKELLSASMNSTPKVPQNILKVEYSPGELVLFINCSPEKPKELFEAMIRFAARVARASKLNSPFDGLPEMQRGQLRFVRDKLPPFLVTALTTIMA